jgi:hypothetical protein
VPVTVRPFEEKDTASWEMFSRHSLQSTMQHTRRFLAYHQGRFEDHSLVVEDGGRWLGVLPAALHPMDRAVVVTHPGASFGGVVHKGGLRGEKMFHALSLVCEHFGSQGIKQLTYKAVPTFYHRAPAQDDLHALFRLGANLTRIDLSSTVDLGNRLQPSERRRRSLKKANQSGVKLVQGSQHVQGLWDVLTDNLAKKHGVTPVHTLSEMMLLMSLFPEEILLVCAMFEDQIVAGVVIFRTQMADHAQYIASNAQGYEMSALDLVFDQCISIAANSGKRWFDFGISTESNGRVLNEGLYGFKSEFGSGGFVHEFFSLSL